MASNRLGPFEVFSWSISGNETCVTVRTENMNFCFDIGFSPRPAVRCDYVFISHGHIDHVGAISQHMRKRQLNRLQKAQYFMPPHLIDHVRTICKTFNDMHGGDLDYLLEAELIPVAPGRKLHLNQRWLVEVLPTDHAVTSQGYLLSTVETDGSSVPQIAYLGDSRFTVLQAANSTCPALLSVRLLIMEATFLDRPEELLRRAHKYGHTHMEEIRENTHLFKSVEYIFLIHFSDRYSAEQIHRYTRSNLPDWLADRITPSLFAKQCLDRQ